MNLEKIDTIKLEELFLKRTPITVKPTPKEYGLETRTLNGDMRQNEEGKWTFVSLSWVDGESDHYYLKTGDTIRVGEDSRLHGGLSKYPFYWTEFEYEEAPSERTSEEWNELYESLIVIR